MAVQIKIRKEENKMKTLELESTNQDIQPKRKSVIRRKLDQASKETIVKLICSFLVTLAGLAGYWVAGLW
jgi:hypothetical protein